MALRDGVGISVRNSSGAGYSPDINPARPRTSYQGESHKPLTEDGVPPETQVDDGESFSHAPGYGGARRLGLPRHERKERMYEDQATLRGNK
jgi:hypothetical protein